MKNNRRGLDSPDTWLKNSVNGKNKIQESTMCFDTCIVSLYYNSKLEIIFDTYLRACENIIHQEMNDKNLPRVIWYKGIARYYDIKIKIINTIEY